MQLNFIGAGSAGSSTAFHLDRFRDPCQPLNITVYERSNYVGGRSTTVNVYGDVAYPIELGASIFVEVNTILYSAAREFGLILNDAGDESPKEAPQMLGVWDGEGFRFVADEGGNYFWGIAKLLWKYGLAPIRMQMLMKKTVGAFTKMYEEPYFPWRSLSQTSFDLGLTDVTSLTGSKLLEQNGVSSTFATDIVQASTRVNYAQNLNQIHGLETTVCMATDGAVAVKGGNWQIFQGMLTAAGANVALNTSIASIEKLDNGTYRVNHGDTFDNTNRDLYDSVVIAAPFQFADLEFWPPLARYPDHIKYVNLHVTLFATPYKLAPGFFNLPPGEAPPETILTTLPGGADGLKDSMPAMPFFSVSTLRSVLNPAYNPSRLEYVYKIFSPKPLTSSLLSSLFDFEDTKTELSEMPEEDVSWVFEKSWFSYPYLPPRVTFEDPQLDTNLWYTSGIESFISTMETSSLMGMNVAKLITNDWAEAKEKPKEEL